MRFGVLVSVFFAAVALSGAARAEGNPVGGDFPPATGKDELAGGAVLLGIGALSFATAPICKSGIVGASDQSACFTASFVAGAPFLALGIPLLVYGLVQGPKYREWARRHPAYAGLSVAPGPGGAAVGFRASF